MSYGRSEVGGVNLPFNLIYVFLCYLTADHFVEFGWLKELYKNCAYKLWCMLTNTVRFCFFYELIFLLTACCRWWRKPVACWADRSRGPAGNLQEEARWWGETFPGWVSGKCTLWSLVGGISTSVIYFQEWVINHSMSEEQTMENKRPKLDLNTC